MNLKSCSLTLLLLVKSKLLCYNIAVKKCQICGREAHIFLTQLVNGETTDLSLCERCAKERGFFDPRALGVDASIFPENLKQKVDELIHELTHQQERASLPELAHGHPADFVCHSCGLRFEQMLQTGRVGCPECYKLTLHARRHPSGVQFSVDQHEQNASRDEPDSIESQRARLLAQMEQAVRDEHYEEAACLRDLLNELESDA